MSRIIYKQSKLRAATRDMIEKANEVIAEHERIGIDLTLRQIYYKFVKSNWIANDEKNYKALGNALNEGRLCGLIDWDGMEDRMRNLVNYRKYHDPAELIEESRYTFGLDLWRDQKNYVEVWVEKDALVSVISKACQQRRVPHFACRGYCSQSEMHAAAMRFRNKIEEEDKSRITIIHLGDHDPSGIDMSRDIEDRLTMFMAGGTDVDRDWHQEDYADLLTVKRIALTMDQVRQYDCPPNPAKTSDARFNDYQEKYGDESWELDALEPMVMVNLIRQEVDRYYDQRIGRAVVELENQQSAELEKIINNWDKVSAFVQGLDE